MYSPLTKDILASTLYSVEFPICNSYFSVLLVDFVSIALDSMKTYLGFTVYTREKETERAYAFYVWPHKSRRPIRIEDRRAS